MKIAITRLYKQNAQGDLIAADITLMRAAGQVRKINGKVGGPNMSERYVTELKGAGTLHIEVEPGTVLHMHPVVG